MAYLMNPQMTQGQMQQPSGFFTQHNLAQNMGIYPQGGDRGGLDPMILAQTQMRQQRP